MATKPIESRYTAVAAAQLILGRTFAINPDGKWGRYTQSAYDSSTADVQASVRSVVKAISGLTVVQLAAERIAERASGRMAVVDRTDIKKLIEKYATEEGVPIPTAMKIAYLESRFDPLAKSPTGAKGVYQFTSIAIEDLKRRANFVMGDPFDPVQNIIGGMKFIKLVARDVGVKLTDVPFVYMAFNIGPRGAKAVLSGKADSVASFINKQAYGPPDVYQARLTDAVNRA